MVNTDAPSRKVSEWNFVALRLNKNRDRQKYLWNPLVRTGFVKSVDFTRVNSSRMPLDPECERKVILKNSMGDLSERKSRFVFIKCSTRPAWLMAREKVGSYFFTLVFHGRAISPFNFPGLAWPPFTQLSSDFFLSRVSAIYFVDRSSESCLWKSLDQLVDPFWIEPRSDRNGWLLRSQGENERKKKNNRPADENFPNRLRNNSKLRSLRQEGNLF